MKATVKGNYLKTSHDLNCEINKQTNIHVDEVLDPLVAN